MDDYGTSDTVVKIQRRVEQKSQNLLSSLPSQYIAGKQTAVLPKSQLMGGPISDASSEKARSLNNARSVSNGSGPPAVSMPLVMDANLGFPSKRTNALRSLQKKQISSSQIGLSDSKSRSRIS